MKLRQQLGLIVSATATLLMGASAHAGMRPFMPLGATVAPPPGYTDLCERGEASCGTLDLAASASTTTPTSALATSSIGGGWTVRFATPASETETETEAFTHFKVLRPYRPVVDADFVAAGDWTGASAQPARNAASAASVASAYAPVAPAATTTAAFVSNARMRMVNAINRDVNRDVHKATDFELYGLLEYWSLPRVIDGKMYGDCEDYALEKRRRLIEAGVPAQALSMAVAVTARGESHAVLVVSFNNGDWVLDNLTPWATPWEDLNYRWVQRQVAGSGTWTTIG